MEICLGLFGVSVAEVDKFRSVLCPAQCKYLFMLRE